MVHTQSEVLCSYLKKKNEKSFHELIWSDFQEILLTEKSQVQKNIYSILPFK